MVGEGRIAAYGVSVERVEEALKAIEYPNVASVQIIFNRSVSGRRACSSRRPRAAASAIIVRVPLASGLLSGKYTRETTFAADDHRNYNRHGETFDVGETFAGVPYEAGLDAVEELRALVPDGATLAQLALRWILMHDAVSTVIPGARSPEQARGNAAAAALPRSRRHDGAHRGGLRRAHRAVRPPALVALLPELPGELLAGAPGEGEDGQQGLTPPLVTCSEPSATVTPSWPQTRPHGSVTEVGGSEPMRQVPAWCWPALGPFESAHFSGVAVRAPLARSHSSARCPRNAAA